MYKRQVRIGTISTLNSYRFPVLIKGFWKQYPMVKFQLHQGDYSTIPEMVATGTVDMGFINPNPQLGFKTKFLKTGNLLAVLPKKHPLAERGSIKLKDLAKEPFFLLESGLLSAPMDDFRKKGLNPQVRLVTHDADTILSLVEMGLGISILPALVLTSKRNNYKVEICPTDPFLSRSVGLITREDDLLPIASKCFINYLTKEVDNL